MCIRDRGYYVDIKDASTNFFFDHLGKGVYVLEYSYRVSRAGTDVYKRQVLKIMAKKRSSLVRKILSEVGRNEMLSWGYRIEK